MKRKVYLTSALMLIAFTLMLLIGVDYFFKKNDTFPFRCSTFSRYDLSRKEGNIFEFAVTQDLRFQDEKTGYLLLNGQAISGDTTTILDRRIILSSGNKIDNDTYRYTISNTITSSTDTTPDTLFNKLLAELTLDHSYLQLSVDKVDDKSYLIGAPLSYLFTCQRY
ncbi:FidL-like protein [Erwinia billingiae]|uniref:FidL-like protein n=1 Tax=Erwinia billingiae TaxID=182337 RepID=UPI0022456EAF|nr:FidL-like protein [Erwinia billingiae]